MSREQMSKIELDIIRLATPLENYGTIAEAFEALANTRDYQLKAWPAATRPDAGGRTPEEWQLLLNHYITKLNAVYAESDGNTPEGHARYAKYAAIVANLALWLVQATVGPVNDDKRAVEGAAAIGAPAPVDGCKFHTAAETQADGFGN